ncbi:MAG: phosphodiester glycosidase family protein [Odoribacteraceae bacterium]|jgi:exopolysaccharide biosynthesis protein|nr:phosphodiester glycosidase family protein [Odoribacteraceae bacterium]
MNTIYSFILQSALLVLASCGGNAPTSILHISSLEKQIGVFGETLSINGSGFSPGVAGNTVLFGTRKAEVVHAVPTRLEVIVPYNYTDSADVRVMNERREVSNSLVFKYDLPACDSIAIVTAEWQRETIREDVTWRSARFRLFDAPRSVNVLEITPSASTRIGIAYTTGGVKKSSDLCVEEGAIAGINAGYFNATGPADYLRIDGEVITTGRDYMTYVDALLSLEENNIIRFFKLDNSNVSARVFPGTTLLACGPLLLSASEILPQGLETHYTETHPRTAIGRTATDKILMITVDGRFPDVAVGLSTRDLAFLMRVLGAVDAMNLDGGGSTTMYVKDRGESGVVNYPCDNGTFNHAGERSVGSVIYIK